MINVNCSKKVAIMQPTFLPWLGYFALIDSVDEFILLDNVQFDKRSWQQRNKILSNNGPLWLTVPVLSKGKLYQKINDVQINRMDNTSPFVKHLRSIENNYKKAPFFEDYFAGIEEILSSPTEKLSVLNFKLICLICTYLGMHFQYRWASSLPVNGAKDELLFNICQAVNASHYISPPGSMNYLEQSKLFSDSDIQVDYFSYDHPSYNQLSPSFESHLSVIDLLFNEGHRSLDIIKSGVS